MKHSEAAERIAVHVETAFARSLSSMTGQEFVVKREKQRTLEEPEAPIVWRQALSPDPELPVFWLVAGKDLWLTAGQLTMSAVGVESASEEDCRSTWQEIAGQTIGGIATAFTSDLQREITAAKGEAAETAPEELGWTVFSARRQDAVFYFRAGWMPSLEELYQHSETEPEEKAQTPLGTNFSKTFDLLLDVALPVNVSFGRTHLQIREVLKLNTGSIVELNRLVMDPVDVIVNDCVIARGEVVVVDGNYGVRVTHLASREDRLRFGMSQTSARVAAIAGGGGS